MPATAVAASTSYPSWLIVRRDETAMLKSLVAKGADMNTQDLSGQTAFAWAAGSDATACGNRTRPALPPPTGLSLPRHAC